MFFHISAINYLHAHDRTSKIYHKKKISEYITKQILNQNICFSKNKYINLLIKFTCVILFTHNILYFKIMVLKVFITYFMNH